MTGLQNQLGLSYGSECDAMASWVQMGGSFSMTEMTMGKSDPVTMGLSRFFCDAPSPLSEWQSRVVQEAQGRDQVISSPDAQTQGQLDKTNARLAQHNAQAKDRISQCRLRLHHYLKRPWLPGAARHITALRAKIESLTQSIKAPVPFSQLSRQIAAIAASGRALDDKKAMVEHLRLDAGLTKGEMRELFTKRIAEVTEESYKRLETDARTLGQRPTDPALHLGMPGSIYTPQAFYAQMNQTLATQTATTDLSRLRQQTSFLRGLYPKPKKRGFWGKIKSGFAKVGGAFKTIGGIDQTYTSNNRIISAAVVIDRKSLKEIEAKYSVMEVNFPYIPGFLSYRELPAMVEAYRMLEQRPDMIIIDGNGILHPRRLGLASHLGILLDAVTIGVAKNLLSGEVDGERVIIDKEVRGYRLVTKEHANPIFISPGHKIGLASAIDLAKKLIIPPHKLPEPVHLAHKLANRVKKELKDAEDAVKGVAPSPA